MKEKLKLAVSLLLGNSLLAFSVCAFVVPNGIMLGGSNGIALFLQQFIPLPLSVLAAAVNMLLFVLGLVFLGWKFAATSLFSTLVYPLILAVMESLPLGSLFHENIVINGLFCGILCGLGVGLVIRVGSSTGGMDIPPCILRHYFGIPVGTSILFFDTLVVLMQMAVKGTDGILFSIMVIIVMSFTVNRTVVTGEKKIQIIIISPENQTIRQKILQDVNCGVTMLEAEGGYKGQPNQAILSVVYAGKYPVIRDLALKTDPNAFIVASEVTNVHGKGYTLAREKETSQ